jgi:nicotinate-nucleotide pyrophosphorylase (carboxylating)
VQCESLGQVEAAIKAGADIVLLTGMNPAQIKECVELVGDRAITEASGDVALGSVRTLAQTGVDRISVGALTQGASALGLELQFEAV